MRAAEAAEVSGNVYNVGTGRSVSVRELIAAVNDALGTDLEPTFADSRAGDVRFSQADVTRTRDDLGYEPSVAFEDGLRQTVDWHLQTIGKRPRLRLVC